MKQWKLTTKKKWDQRGWWNWIKVDKDKLSASEDGSGVRSHKQDNYEERDIKKHKDE